MTDVGKFKSLPRVSPENQRAFAESWGDDFNTMRFSGFWAGASKDGTMIGVMMQTHGNTKELRASFSYEEIAVILANLVCAIATALDRRQAMADGKSAN